MNAAARALSQNSLVEGQAWNFSVQTLGMVLLLIAVLASALAVVYVKALQRELFSELQSTQQTRDTLHTEWGQLLLEQNTWAAPVRVQALAQQQLGMVVPTSKDVVMVPVTHKN